MPESNGTRTESSSASSGLPRELEQLAADVLRRAFDQVRSTKFVLWPAMICELKGVELRGGLEARNVHIGLRAQLFEDSVRSRIKLLLKIATNAVIDTDRHKFGQAEVDSFFDLLHSEREKLCSEKRAEAQATMMDYFDALSSEE